MTSAISWFELPATDIKRATKFYETIFGITMSQIEMDGIIMSMFPLDDPMGSGVGGALVAGGDFHKASTTDGPFIYLNGNPDLQKVLDKVEAAGGNVIMPKTEISPEYGFMGAFIDTEGNRVGLHCM